MLRTTNENEPVCGPLTTLTSQVAATVNERIDIYSSNIKSSAPWHSPNIKSSAPWRSQRQNIFQRAYNRVQLAYYRYEVTFGLYVLTFNEKLVVNAFALTVISLVSWALLYFPALVYNKGDDLIWLLTGHRNQQIGIVL
ncbi:hypothetical protein N7447_002541 [Penicillium robsamsonii]|uniref:uncharacterized protein n=1 Tax=Penicillium robsamsonii TaxID=1792511 RepID=UPI0025494049|nr:uncharacterized protein N7447_002541 [Penicillium robsamsonii]KAJ5836515.1 hypothetical protein N7447_002541 [Penicillium robsamsonii]